jgi:fatty-acid desaturase
MKEIVNMKKINITKYKGNTHYNIHVIDSFGQEHHLGFFYCHIAWDDIERQAEEIWSNETKNVYDDSLDKAIQNCIELDNKAGRENGGLSINK